MRQLHGHQGTQVSRRVRVRVEFATETRRGEVVKVVHGNRLPIRRMFRRAGNPHLIPQLRFQTLNVLLQFLRHLLGQIRGVVVVLGHPVEDAVQLEEDARPRLIESVIPFAGTILELGQFQAAHFAW